MFERLERQFHYPTAVVWSKKYWVISIYASIIYVITIFAIQRWMRDRKPYDLRRWLFGWSLMLSLFSMVGFYHTGIPLITTAFTKSWFATICKPYKSELFEENVPLLASQPAMWAYIFCLAKLPELFDTIFVVLRKQKLILLHWYHHITVMVYCYFHVAYMVVPGQWFVVMNYFVHSVMYSYYAIRATGLIRPPKWVMMVITALQLSQMAVGVWINVYVFRMMQTTPDFYCDERIETSYFYVNIAFAMYLSYFMLFLHFFYTTYLKKGEAKIRKTADSHAVPSEEQDKRQDHRSNGDIVTSAGNGALHKRK